MSGQLIDCGKYTPTPTNTTNLDASTSSEFMWFRIGDLVHVAGRVDVDPTAAAPTTTQLDLSLPLSSNFTDANDLAGVAATGTFTEVGVCRASVANDRCEVIFQAVSTTNHGLRLEFTYRLRH